jgi:hypothetical protein
MESTKKMIEDKIERLSIEMAIILALIGIPLFSL